MDVLFARHAEWGLLLIVCISASFVLAGIGVLIGGLSRWFKR